MGNEVRIDELAVQHINVGSETLFDTASVIYSNDPVTNSISGNRFYRIADKDERKTLIYDSRTATANIINDTTTENIPDSAYAQQVISTQTNFSRIHMEPTKPISFGEMNVGGNAQLPKRESVTNQPQITLTRTDLELNPTDAQLTRSEYKRIDLEAMYPSSIEAELEEHLQNNPPPPLHSHIGYEPAPQQTPAQSASQPVKYSKAVQDYLDQQASAASYVPSETGINTNAYVPKTVATPVDKTGANMSIAALVISILSILACFSGISILFGAAGVILSIKALKEAAPRYKPVNIVASVLSFTGFLAGVLGGILI